MITNFSALFGISMLAAFNGDIFIYDLQYYFALLKIHHWYIRKAARK